MERHDDGALPVFTDGSCLPGPRRGGIGILVLGIDEHGEEVLHPFSPDGYPGATNQEMEIKACTEALRVLHGPDSPVDLDDYRKIVICTDSQFVWRHHKTALYEWQSNGWKTKDGAPVVNAEYWDELIGMIFKVGRPVVFEWVKGKKGRHAKIVDRLAKDSATRPYGRALTHTSVRRKRSEEPVEPGSVTIDGRELDIYIVTTRHLTKQKCWRFKYEVASVRDPDHGKSDFICANEVLRDGRTYRVRLNSDPGNPWIDEVLNEVKEATD